MKRILFLVLLSLALFVGTVACQEIDVPNGDVQENTYSDFVFPTEAVLSLKTATASEVTAALNFWTASDGDLESVQIRFVFERVPCKANKQRVTLSANGLSGRVHCYKYYRYWDKAGSESLPGKFYFDARLNRTMNRFGDEAHLGEGDKLTGNWTIRFEADNGTKLLFKVSSVEIVTNIPF